MNFGGPLSYPGLLNYLKIKSCTQLLRMSFIAHLIISINSHLLGTCTSHYNIIIMLLINV